MREARWWKIVTALAVGLWATVSLAADRRAGILRPEPNVTGAGPATSAANAAVLARFIARPDEPTRSFRAYRWLSITSGALGKAAWMEVEIEVDPRSGFRYSVLAAGGSHMLQDRILHKVLRTEQEVYARGDNPKTALTVDNYSLVPDGRDERGLVRLLATARRKDVGLLNGQFLLTPDTADLIEVSGTMAKPPSFWIPRVDLTKRYTRVQGHRVNIRVDSVSHVRLLGESHFTMTTRYESIDGDMIRPEAASAGDTP